MAAGTNRRQHHRAHQCEHDGDRHRVKHFPSTPVSAKIGRYTAVMMPTPKGLGRITSAVAVAASSKRSSAASARPRPALRFAEAAQAVLHDDHRAVDDEAEVECAETHQVAGDAARTMPITVMSIAERDHGGRDQRRAQVTEQQEQHRR